MTDSRLWRHFDWILLLVVMHFSYELTRMENRVRTLAEEVTLLRHRLEVDEAASTTPDDHVPHASGD